MEYTGKTTSLAAIVSTAVSGVLFAMSPHLPCIAAFVLSSMSLVSALMLVRGYGRHNETESVQEIQ
jgi:hypothetical protein